MALLPSSVLTVRSVLSVLSVYLLTLFRIFAVLTIGTAGTKKTRKPRSTSAPPFWSPTKVCLVRMPTPCFGANSKPNGKGGCNEHTWAAGEIAVNSALSMIESEQPRDVVRVVSGCLKSHNRLTNGGGVRPSKNVSLMLVGP
jgi:hypothetical protein